MVAARSANHRARTHQDQRRVAHAATACPSAPRPGDMDRQRAHHLSEYGQRASPVPGVAPHRDDRDAPRRDRRVALGCLERRSAPTVDQPYPSSARRTSFATKNAPVDAASNWTPTPNGSSKPGAIANVKTGIALGRTTQCSPAPPASRYTRSRSANCLPGSSRVRDCLTSGSTNTPTHARSPVRRPRQTGRRRIRSFDRKCPSAPAMRAANSRHDVYRTARRTR